MKEIMWWIITFFNVKVATSVFRKEVQQLNFSVPCTAYSYRHTSSCKDHRPRKLL